MELRIWLSYMFPWRKNEKMKEISVLVNFIKLIDYVLIKCFGRFHKVKFTIR